MKYKISVMLIAGAITLIFTGCKKTSTEPEKVIKTPREMTWTADTLKPLLDAFQLLPENLVVLSPNDIWLVCYSDIARGLIWHYDGKTWTESNIFADVGGMRVNDIAKGNNARDMWAVGYSGDQTFIGYYDGIKWNRYAKTWNGELLDMCKDPEGNIWACGRNGLILKYDNTKWISDTINLKLSSDVSYWLKSIEFYNGKIQILASTANRLTQKEKYFFLSGNLDSFDIIDSMEFNTPTSIIKWGNFGLITSNDKNGFYSYGLKGVWKYYAEKWQNILELPLEIYGMYSLTSDYMLVAGPFSNLFFYDGTKWDKISNIVNIIDPNFVFKNVWTNGYETFIVGRNFQGITKTIIFRGK